MKRCRFTTVAVVLVSLTALAQQSGDASTSREQILKLFDVMHIRQQMRTVMESMMKQQASLIRDTMKQRYPHTSERELANMNEFVTETMRDLPVDGLLDDMIPVYQKHLAPADVDAMIAFYSSPTGQKLMQEMPAMTSEGMQAAYPRMQKQMEKVMQRVDEKMRQEAQPKKESTPKSNTPKIHDDSTT